MLSTADYEPYINDMCPLTKFEGGLRSLHEADDNARNSLETTALAKLDETSARRPSPNPNANPTGGFERQMREILRFVAFLFNYIFF